MDKIPVKVLRIGLALDGSGKVVTLNHVTTGNKKVFVIPGKMASIEIMSDDGKVTVAEVPIGQFGWEYEK